MIYDSAVELLDALVQGARLTPTELDEIKDHIDEGQHLEYKDGSITHRGKRKAGRLTVRQYVSAFANADGGVLIVGVSDKPRRISPCIVPHQQSLEGWVADLLRDMTPLLAPPPRVQTVNHSEGSVLVIATARSPNLVSIVEQGRAVYQLRFHDSTLEIPEYLLSDLFLGRRQRPILTLEVRANPKHPHLSPSGLLALSFYFSVSNSSLVTANYVQIGLISWTLSPAAPEPIDYLRAFLDVESSPGEGWVLKHAVAVPKSVPTEHEVAVRRLSPFSRNSHALVAETFDFPSPGPLEVSACAYVLSEGAPPSWWELRFSLIPSKVENPLVVSGLRLDRTEERRPVISVRLGK